MSRTRLPSPLLPKEEESFRSEQLPAGDGTVYATSLAPRKPNAQANGRQDGRGPPRRSDASSRLHPAARRPGARPAPPRSPAGAPPPSGAALLLPPRFGASVLRRGSSHFFLAATGESGARPGSPDARRPAVRWGRDEPGWVPELGGGSVGARPAPAGRSPAPGSRGDAPGRPSPLRPPRMPVTGAARGAARGPGPPARPPGRPTYPMNQSMAARGPPRPPPDTLGPQPATAAAAAGSKHSLAHSHTRAAGAAGSDAPPAARWET